MFATKSHFWLILFNSIRVLFDQDMRYFLNTALPYLFILFLPEVFFPPFGYDGHHDYQGALSFLILGIH